MPKQIQNDEKMKTVSIRMSPMLRLTAKKYGLNLSKLTRVAITHEIKMIQMRRSQSSSSVYAAHPAFYDFIIRLQLHGFLPCGNLISHIIEKNDPTCEIRVTVECVSAGNILSLTMHKFEDTENKNTSEKTS